MNIIEKHIMFERVAILLRKSQADVELEKIGINTLEKHEQQLKELSEKMGLEILEQNIFREVVSGESLTNRPVMQELLRKIMNNEYDAVMVMDVDRLARGNLSDQGTILEAFKLTSTKIITPQKIYDPDDTMDADQFEMKLYFARQEYKAITRRMQTGKMHAIKSGSYQGAVIPFGYEAKKEKRHKFLVPNEKAETVKMIFNMFTEERLPIGAIATKLSSLGIPNPRGNIRWSPTTVKVILKNITYIGHTRWFQSKNETRFDENFKAVKKRVKQEQPMIIENTHEPIISEEQFKFAQTLFNSPRKNTKYELKNPLASILKCSKCGLVIRAKDQTTYAHRFFNCKQKNVKREVIMNKVLNAIENKIQRIEVNLYEMKPDTTPEKIKVLEAELKKIESKKENLFDKYDNGDYTRDEFLSRKKKYIDQIESLSIELNELRSVKPPNFKEKIVTLENVLSELKNESVSAKLKNDMLKEIIEKIEMWNDKEEGLELNIFFK